jgi:hypothetical protein
MRQEYPSPMTNRKLSPALRDCIKQLGGPAASDNIGLLEDLLNLVLVQGVKIGGIYQHFKGKEYIVTDVVRDADDWEIWKVVYHELTDGRHRAERRVSWFLGDHPEHKVPRFTLVG